MAYIALLVAAIILGLCIGFLRAYGILLLVDMLTIATSKSQFDPQDVHPGLLRVLAPSLVLTLGATAGLLETNPILWLICLLPAGALTVPVLKRCCRMSWATAAKTAAITTFVHAMVLLLLYNFGFRFQINADNDGVW